MTSCRWYFEWLQPNAKMSLNLSIWKRNDLRDISADSRMHVWSLASAAKLRFCIGLTTNSLMWLISRVLVNFQLAGILCALWLMMSSRSALRKQFRPTSYNEHTYAVDVVKARSDDTGCPLRPGLPDLHYFSEQFTILVSCPLLDRF